MGSRRHLLLACLGAVAALGGGTPAAAGDATGPQPPAGPLVPEQAVLDYGVVGQDEEHTRTLALRNAGDKPLVDLGLRTDCGCYTASLSARTLAPGAQATLSVAFRTLTFSGPLTKSVVVGYRVEGGPEQTLRVGLALKVLGGVLAHPGRLHLGDVREGETPQGRVRVGWYEGVGRPFQIRGVETGTAPIEATWAPWQGTEDPRWRGFELALRLRSPPPRGPYFAEVVVLTSDPDRPRVVIPVTALVSGHLYVPRPRVYLGLLRAGTTQGVEVPFRPHDPARPLGTVEVRVRDGRVTARLLPGEGPRGERRVRIELTGREPVGPLDDVVELTCSEAPGEVARIEVRGRVYAAPEAR